MGTVYFNEAYRTFSGTCIVFNIKVWLTGWCDYWQLAVLWLCPKVLALDAVLHSSSELVNSGNGRATMTAPIHYLLVTIVNINDHQRASVLTDIRFLAGVSSMFNI